MSHYTKFKTTVDVHTHTIASGHAYNTLMEMVNAAMEKGQKVFGITDHAPSIPGSCTEIYFRNMHNIPRQWGDMRLLLGAELNILDTTGRLDLDEKCYHRLDIRIAGIHSLCWQGGTQEEDTQAMIAAIENPWTDIISHPGDGTANLLFEPIVLAAKETGTLLEINNSSLNPQRGKVVAKGNNMELLRLCKQYQVPVILGSDAHFFLDIANYERIFPLLQETDFPEELVMNNKPEAFLAWLDKHHEK
ncbi:MAG: phosphatase [Paludibacteraceae bacterium]|nr:phosphatase [Paludibacteraceae bacterium]